MRIIYEPPEIKIHRCDDELNGVYKYETGSIAECSCGQRFILVSTAIWKEWLNEFLNMSFAERKWKKYKGEIPDGTV